MSKYIKLNQFRWLVTIVLTILVAFGTVGSSYGQSIVLNTFISNRSQFIIFGLLLLGVMTLTQILKCILSVNNARLIKQWAVYLGGKVSHKLAKMGYQQYHELDYGEYISWYTTDIERISASYFEPFLNLVSNIVLAIVSIVILFSISWKIGVLSFVLLFIVAIVGSRFGQKIGQAYQQFSVLSGKYTNTLQEYTSGYDVLKNYGQLNILKKKITAAQENLENQRVVAKKYTAFATLSFYGTQKVFEGVMFIFTLYLVMNQEISLGMLLSTPVILSLFLTSTAMLFEIMIQMQSVTEILAKLETLEEVTTYTYPAIDVIEGDNITFEANKKMILSDISFKIEKGKKYGLLGASGSGKSTLLKLILGRLQATKGELRINGEMLDAKQDTQFDQEIAYVSQEGFMFDMTIRENILLGLDKTEQEIFEVLDKVSLTDRVLAFPEQLDTVVGLDGQLLSGGERQRLNLARALIRKTPILILDEATSAIDKKTSLEIERHIISNPSQTVIMISHHLDEEIENDLDHVVRL